MPGDEERQNDAASGSTARQRGVIIQLEDGSMQSVSPEELYDTERDPGCRQNLIHDPAHTETAQSFRHKMLEFLRTTKDAELPKYTAYVTLEGRLPCLTNN